ncbi:ExbD/TolR family protein [Candidatus Thiosymbion oneisti]|uniref:ExbD/TolR family protein n=1 Tax=Candidatus Thiosymbion oneisti TaxID=589554 RepID=UPI000A9BA905|nr:biopolymer transporter ExbD [Candidatus Thiosymbion oneisti]
MNLRPHRLEPPDINLTPMIDVVFLLLIFFMVSTTFQEDTRIRVRLPEAQGEAVPAEMPRALEITIDSAGVFYVDERMLADREPATLQQAIAAVVGEERERPVIIRADAATPHQAVMTAMDAASRLGLLRFSLAATRPDAPR